MSKQAVKISIFLTFLLCLSVFVSASPQGEELPQDAESYRFGVDKNFKTIVEVNLGFPGAEDWEKLTASGESFSVCKGGTNCRPASGFDPENFNTLLDQAGDNADYIKALSESGIIDTVFRSEDISKETKDKYLESFLKLDDAKDRDELWSSKQLTNEAKTELLNELVKKKGLSDKVSFTSGDGNWTESKDGNMLFKPKGLSESLDFDKLENFLTKNEGKTTGKKYSFNAKEFTANDRILEKVTVSENSVVYDFKDNVKVEIAGDDATFDVESGELTVKDKKYTWVNNQGHIKVDKDANIDLSLSLGDTKDVSNFPVLIDEEAKLAKSPYMVKDENAKLPSGITKPKEGYTGFTKDDETFLVDSNGVIRKATKSTISSDGTHSNVFVRSTEDEKSGRLFTSEKMKVITDSKTNVPKEGDYMRVVSEEKKGITVDIKSENGRAYYGQESKVATMDLRGDVSVVNGQSIIGSNKDGSVIYRKFDGSKVEDRLIHDVGELRLHDAKKLEDGSEFPKLTINRDGITPIESKDGKKPTLTIKDGFLVQGEPQVEQPPKPQGQTAGDPSAGSGTTTQSGKITIGGREYQNGGKIPHYGRVLRPSDITSLKEFASSGNKIAIMAGGPNCILCDQEAAKYQAQGYTVLMTDYRNSGLNSLGWKVSYPNDPVRKRTFPYVYHP